MKQMKRVAALLLCLVLVASLVPVAVFATAQDVTYVLAGSDFQNTDNDHTSGAAYVTKLLDQIKAAGYTTMDGFLFAGDYDYGFDDSDKGKAALQGAVQAAYGTDMQEIYVEGNHDRTAFQGVDLVMSGTLSPGGANDSDNYGVYVIHERDYMWEQDSSNHEIIQNTAADLKIYLDAKVAAEYDKPIFVITHLPLHYTMRTRNDGDVMYANHIFDVMNEAGSQGLNLIYLFGHNHSSGWDDYLGGAAIFLKKGDSINIAQGSKTVFHEETLNFTYMNAGYVGYYAKANEGSETDLTMTVFEIREDSVTVKRFSEDGLHELKAPGVTNAYKGESGYSPNTTTYTSPQTIELTKIHTYDDQYDYKCNVCGQERTVDMTRPMVDMFRMYDPNSGEHLYTGSEEEKNDLVEAGWNYEGIGFTFPLTTGDPVYRLYDPVTGEHLYTMDESEKATLMAAGWNYEGIAFNSGFENEVPQYRLHNPNETRGAYHFTASAEERDYLISLGWEYQGIGWYSLGA